MNIANQIKRLYVLSKNRKEDKFSESTPQVVIENDVWIGYGATILGGVKIAHGAVILQVQLLLRMFPLTQ